MPQSNTETILVSALFFIVTFLISFAIMSIIQGNAQKRRQNAAIDHSGLHECPGNCGTLISKTRSICTQCLILDIEENLDSHIEDKINLEVSLPKELFERDPDTDTRLPVVIAIDAKEAQRQAEEAFMHKR